MLPGIDGWQVLQGVRKADKDLLSVIDICISLYLIMYFFSTQLNPCFRTRFSLRNHHQQSRWQGRQIHPAIESILAQRSKAA